MRLIVTRPEPDATRTGDVLQRLGHEPILSPMLDIVFDAEASLPEADYQAVLVTSRNAVRALSSHPQGSHLAALPLLAVGDQTALEAKRAGFLGARSAGGALADLAALVVSELSPLAGPLLYLAGEDKAGDLAGRLGAHGFSVCSVVLYRAAKRERLSGEAVKALRGREPVGILAFSERTASAFAEAVKAEGLAPLPETATVFCLSGAVAAALTPVTTGKIFIAARPDQISLFSLIDDIAAGERRASANNPV